MQRQQAAQGLNIQEIHTGPQYQRPGDRNQIEIVGWEDSPNDSSGSSQTVSLRELMTDQANAAPGEEPVTIDNLWKILSQEKNTSPAPAISEQMARNNRSRSGLRNDSANRQKMAYAAGQFEQAHQGHYQGMPQHLHESARRPRPSDIFNTPYQKQVDLPRLPSSENRAYPSGNSMAFRSAVRDMYASGAKEDYLFRTPIKDSESGARGSTKTGTPS